MPTATAKPQALAIHVFMGGISVGVNKHLETVGQLEAFDLGQATARLNFQYPVVQADPDKAWPDATAELLARVGAFQPPVIYGNPRCTGFSCLNGGLDSDAHGPWARQTKDIHDIFKLLPRLGYRPSIVCFESVQQLGSVGRPLLQHLVETYGQGYRVAELYHCATQFGNAQHRARVVFMLYDEKLQCPALEVTERMLWFNRLPAGSPPWPLDPKGNPRHITLGDVLHDPLLLETPATLLDAKPSEHLGWNDVVEKSPVIPPMCGGDGPDDRLMNHYSFMLVDPDDTRAHIWAQLAPGTSLNDLSDEQLAVSRRHLETRMRGSGFSLHATRRPHPDKACPVIYSASGHYLHSIFNRPLSVRECMRLMGLPDDFVIVGSDQIAQLGKGVTCQVGEWLGALCAAMLAGEHRVDDPGTPWEIFRLDKVEGWVPDRPKIEKPFRREDD